MSSSSSFTKLPLKWRRGDQDVLKPGAYGLW